MLQAIVKVTLPFGKHLTSEDVYKKKLRSLLHNLTKTNFQQESGLRKHFGWFIIL